MTSVRYEVPGVPAGPAMGLSAFLPHFNRQAAGGAMSYKYALAGYPGTKGIPAPPAQVPQRERTAQALQGTATSADAPPSWWPQEYYQTFIAEAPGAGMPILRIDPTNPAQQTVIPVPASVPDYRAGQYQSQRPAGIMQRIAQVQVFPRRYQAPPR